MIKTEIDEFGILIINEVRDRAIERMYRIVSGDIRAQELRDLNDRIMTLERVEAFKVIVRESVDSAIFELLTTVSEHYEEIKLYFQGKDLVEISDGLGGELFSDVGWIALYSKYS